MKDTFVRKKLKIRDFYWVDVGGVLIPIKRLRKSVCGGSKHEW